MDVQLLALLALALGVLAVLAALVALIVPERRLRRWSVIAIGLAATAAVAETLARQLGPPSWVTRLALLAAMVAVAVPAARWVITALADASSPD
jgi:hypothetical protein